MRTPTDGILQVISDACVTWLTSRPSRNKTLLTIIIIVDLPRPSQWWTVQRLSVFAFRIRLTECLLYFIGPLTRFITSTLRAWPWVCDNYCVRVKYFKKVLAQTRCYFCDSRLLPLSLSRNNGVHEIFRTEWRV